MNPTGKTCEKMYILVRQIENSGALQPPKVIFFFFFLQLNLTLNHVKLPMLSL